MVVCGDGMSRSRSGMEAEKRMVRRSGWMRAAVVMAAFRGLGVWREGGGRVESARVMARLMRLML